MQDGSASLTMVLASAQTLAHDVALLRLLPSPLMAPGRKVGASAD